MADEKEGEQEPECELIKQQPSHHDPPIDTPIDKTDTQP